MLQSMTGYVTKSINFPLDAQKNVVIDLTLKSLNSKYFENNIKLPHVFYALEHEITKLLKQELKRGTVYLYVSLGDTNAFKTKVNVSFESLDGYINAINKIKETYNITDTIKIADVVRLPNIFTYNEENLTEEQKTFFMNEIAVLAQELLRERNKEGAALKKDIDLRLINIKREIDNIAQAFELQFSDKQAQISEKIESTLLQDDNFADNQRKILYALLDKIDIHEEIVRFKSHINKLEELLNADNVEKGKSLDFTMQELAREINTILAKTSNAAISHIGLNIKVEIEKTREQVQNLV